MKCFYEYVDKGIHSNLLEIEDETEAKIVVLTGWNWYIWRLRSILNTGIVFSCDSHAELTP